MRVVSDSEMYVTFGTQILSVLQKIFRNGIT